MKVAVTSQGNDLNSRVDLRFGRSKWIIIVDTETGKFAAHDNQVNLDAQQGAGIQTGSNVVNLGAESVITGNVGPKAFRILTAGKVNVYLTKDLTVEEAIDSYKSGELKQAVNANVESHWS